MDPSNEDELGNVLIELIRALKSKKLRISDVTWLLSLSPKTREQAMAMSTGKLDLLRFLKELNELEKAIGGYKIKPPPTAK